MELELVACKLEAYTGACQSGLQPTSIVSVGTSDSSTSRSYTLYAANVLLQKEPCTFSNHALILPV